MLIICFTVVLQAVALLSSCNKDTNLQIVEDISWFSDFIVDGEKVYIYCVVVINNPGNERRTFNLKAYFPDDVEPGLLKNSELQGYEASFDNSKLFTDLTGDDIELTNGEFTIEKKERESYQVVFVGDFAGTKIKHNRLLPEIEIMTIE